MCKTSKFVTKETSLLLLQTPWHLLKPPINFSSRWGDSLTDVGYNFSQVKISTFSLKRSSVVLLSGIVYKFDVVLLFTPTRLATELERTIPWRDVTIW